MRWELDHEVYAMRTESSGGLTYTLHCVICRIQLSISHVLNSNCPVLLIKDGDCGPLYYTLMREQFSVLVGLDGRTQEVLERWHRHSGPQFSVRPMTFLEPLELSAILNDIEDIASEVIAEKQ